MGFDDRSTGSGRQMGEEHGEGEQLGGNKGLEWGESLMKSFLREPELWQSFVLIAVLRPKLSQTHPERGPIRSALSAGERWRKPRSGYFEMSFKIFSKLIVNKKGWDQSFSSRPSDTEVWTAFRLETPSSSIMMTSGESRDPLPVRAGGKGLLYSELSWLSCSSKHNLTL